MVNKNIYNRTKIQESNKTSLRDYMEAKEKQSTSKPQQLVESPEQAAEIFQQIHHEAQTTISELEFILSRVRELTEFDDPQLIDFSKIGNMDTYGRTAYGELSNLEKLLRQYRSFSE